MEAGLLILIEMVVLNPYLHLPLLWKAVATHSQEWCQKRQLMKISKELFKISKEHLQLCSLKDSLEYKSTVLMDTSLSSS